MASSIRLWFGDARDHRASGCTGSLLKLVMTSWPQTG
jgi:hypothetical protein